MDQLKPLDSLFLDLETPAVQANIGGISVFEGPPPTYDELAAQVEAGLDRHPRYRQKLRHPPLKLGGAVWVDDAQFDIERHLIPQALPSPRGMRQLTDLFAQIVSEHLDRRHSLWQVHFVERVGRRGQWAVCWKVHHAMVDGLAARELLDLLVTPDPKAPTADSADWQARALPSEADLLAETFTSPIGPLKIWNDIRSAAATPTRAAAGAVTATRAAVPIARSLVGGHASPLNGPIQHRRRYDVAQLDLATIKRAGKRHGATVNDIVLAACTTGLRDLLVERGLDPHAEDARTMVPVALRETAGEKLDNDISAVFIDLPVDFEDPVDRLNIIRAQMAHQKRSRGVAAGEALFELAGYVPPVLLSVGERLAWRAFDTQRLMNTITTNVPGPQFPLYCLGRKMTALYPYVMLPKNIRVATAIFSYDGKVNFGVSGDYDAMPDIDVVRDGIERSLKPLLGARGKVNA